MKSQFNENEASVIRELHDSFVAGKTAVEPQQLSDKCGISHSDLESLRIRLKNYGAIDPSNSSSFVVGERVVEVVRELDDHPSPREHVLAEKTAPRSRLLVACIVLSVGIPLAYVWFQIFRDVARWVFPH